MNQHDLVLLLHGQDLPTDKIYQRLVEVFGPLTIADSIMTSTGHTAEKLDSF
jgi:hypothetical protein